MTPVERAAAVYEKEPCARSFKEDLEAHLLHGLVYSSGDFFCMARPVCKEYPQHLIVNPWFNEWDAPANCWHLYLWAGPMLSAFKCATHPLPFVSFERKNRLKIYLWEQVFNTCRKLNQH